MNQFQMKDKQKSEVLSKLQQLNLSSSSSEISFDSRIQRPKSNNQSLLKPYQIPKLYNGHSILNDLQANWETKDFKKKNFQSRKISKHYEDKENINQNLVRNTFYDPKVNSNRFYLSRNIRNKQTQNLLTSPNLSKKNIDESFEDDEDPLKIYEKLKEKINKEIKLNKQKNEQYTNEVNILHSELYNLKLKEQNFQRDTLNGICQGISYGYLQNYNNQNMVIQMNISQQYYLPQFLQTEYPKQNTISSCQETKSNNNGSKSNIYDIQSNLMDTLSTYQCTLPVEQINNNIMNKKPFQSHSFLNLDNSKKKNNLKIQQQKSKLQIQYGNLKMEDDEFNDNQTQQNDELLVDQSQNSEQNNQKLSNQQKLKVIINHNIKNTIPQSNNEMQQQKNETFWKRLDQKRQTCNLQKKIKYISNDESDNSQDNDIDYNQIKSIYEHNKNEESLQQQQIIDNSNQLFENQIPVKKKMKIKPLKLGSEQQDHYLKHIERSPLQNLKIKEQENYKNEQQIKKSKQKLQTNSKVQMNSYNSESIIKRKTSTGQSFETSSYDKKQMIASNQCSKQQTPNKSKKQNKGTSTKKIKPLVEQSAFMYFNNNYSKKNSNPQLNNLQTRKMNSLHHSKAQINSVENLEIKQKYNYYLKKGFMQRMSESFRKRNINNLLHIKAQQKMMNPMQYYY